MPKHGGAVCSVLLCSLLAKSRTQQALNKCLSISCIFLKVMPSVFLGVGHSTDPSFFQTDWILYLCKCVWICECRCPWSPEEDVISLGAEGNCELLDIMGAGN